MRLMTKPWAVACLAVATLSGISVAVAQEAGSAPAANAPAREVGGGQDVALTPKQMLDNVKTVIPEMDRQRGAVAEQLADAKNKKDVVKALCLDDKVKQMKLATDTARDRVINLTSSVGQNDPARSKHEFTVIQVLRERVQTLVAEAQQCIGEETGFIGNQDITVDIDPAIPDADPSDFPDDPLVSDPPVTASPTF
jgi:hypothetical protein